MHSLLPLVICALAFPLCGWAEDAPNSEQIQRLVRGFAFASAPSLNTNTEFRIRKLEVKGLWEELKLQVVNVEYLIRGQAFNECAVLFYDGKVTSLAPTIGGHGVMSGVAHQGEFYFTYSWGSGIHRSHVARLQVANGSLKRSDSGGFRNMDLFVSTGAGEKVHVFAGELKGLNEWAAGRDIGTVGITNASKILFLSGKGDAVAPTFP
jgi:hypothetical protein